MRASAAALFLALGLFGVALLSGAPAAAQQFSADLVSTNAHGRREDAAGKLYVGPGIVRIEPPGVRNGRFLTDPGAGAALFLMPAQRVFMDAKQSSRLTQILTPVDPNDPCPAWDAMAKIAGSDRGGHWACDACRRRRRRHHKIPGDVTRRRDRLRLGRLAAEIPGQVPIRRRRRDRARPHSGRTSARGAVRDPRRLPQIRSPTADRSHQAKRRVGRPAQVIA